MPFYAKKNTSHVPRPNAFLYYLVGLFAGLYFRLILGLKVDRSAIKNLKPPFFVIAGHTSWIDFLTVSIAMLPHRMNYLAAYNFFRNPVLKFLLTLVGVIPKNQFTSDNKAILKTRYVVSHGGIIAIFPHGCLSNEGRPGGFAAPSIAKLLKAFKIPVVLVKIDGGYLTRPRWTKRIFRGRMHVQISTLFTPDDLQQLTNDEIYSKVLDSIHFDDYKWQRIKQIPFRGKKRAEGVELVLYKCPKCLSEFSLRSKENTLYCENCNNKAEMNERLFFESVSPESVIFDGIDNWYDFQKEHLLTEIQNTDFELTANTQLQWNDPGKYGYQKMGNGSLQMNRESIIYKGSVLGKQEILIFNMKDIVMVPYAAGEYFEIAKGSDIRRFVLEDVRMMMKWVLAIRLIRDEFYENQTPIQ